MALLKGEAQTESLMRVLLFDYSFLLFFSLVACSLLSSLNRRRSVAIKRLYSFIFGGFVLALAFIAGSKSVILIIFNLMIKCAISYQKTQPRGNVFVPAVTFVGLLALADPILFATVLAARLAGNAKIGIGALANFWASVDSARLIIVLILDRFCYDGIEGLFFIFHGVWIFDFNGNFRQDFYSYLKKNLLNSLLPGTVYPEAYAPSSQIFGSILFGDVPQTDMSSAQLLANLNTQQYTLFGVVFMFGSVLGPAITFIFGSVLVLLYRLGPSLIFRAMSLGYFGSTLSSFGPETNIANATQLFISMMFLAGVMLLLSRLNMRRQ